MKKETSNKEINVTRDGAYRELGNEGIDYPEPNRNYKDTVFRFLYRDPKYLLDLYNALHGSNYTNPSELEIVTLDNAIYLAMKNDLAFILGTGLYLYEHQSTDNPNLPLRFLLYVAIEYEKLIDKDTLYTSKLVQVPAPEFIVFYNGMKDIEDRKVLCLSSAYYNFEGEPNLELKATVLNVNAGHNADLLKTCKSLGDYAEYVRLIRNYCSQGYGLRDATELAVEECIRRDVLRDFLQKNKQEVLELSFLEYNHEYEMEKLRKAEREIGYDEGLDAGYSKGHDAGYGEGHDAGFDEGKKSMAKALANINMSVEQIAELANTTVQQVQEWLAESVASK